MSLILGSGNKDTELKLMARFRAEGITGWRRKSKLFGKPDFVFPKLKLAVFVDGRLLPKLCKSVSHFRTALQRGQFGTRVRSIRLCRLARRPR